MFVLYKKENRFCGAFKCDKCNEIIENWDKASAIINKDARGSPYYAHVHNVCLKDNPQSKISQRTLPLRDFIKEMIKSFPWDLSDFQENQ
jgi:hypothetical protein